MRPSANAAPVYIRGGDSKREVVGRSCDAPDLDVSGHSGIIDYQPDELVISARAGTPLAELDAALAEHGQALPFEPPRLGGRATLGGTLACNLSGPGRPWLGSVRDAVLGLQLINGQAQVLEFGGKVMKNVAGYDVSRLQAGALGTLGVITEIHVKVLPQAEASLTLAYEMDAPQARETMCSRAAQPKPLTGAAWVDGRLFLRLAGAQSAVNHNRRPVGRRAGGRGNLGEPARDATPFFQRRRTPVAAVYRRQYATHRRFHPMHRLGRGPALVARRRGQIAGAVGLTPRPVRRRGSRR